MVKYIGKFALVGSILVILGVGINNADASVPTVSLTSPADNSTYTVPASITLTSSASDSGATISRVDYYANATYLGEATRSPYTLVSTSLQAGTYSLTAVATDSKGYTATSAAINITVNPHTAPTISLATPANNASYNAPANLTLTANASVTGGTITKVDYYYGSNYIGTAYSSPYTYTWNAVAAGTYSLTAKATDSYGWSTTSNPVTVTVVSLSPVVTIISPANNSTFTAGSSVTVTATASESGGSIASVSFYDDNGTNLISTSTSAPYGFTVTAPAGTYTITAVATDANGSSTTSSSVTIIVNGLPVVAITSPANNSTATAGSNLTITASASETGGTISSVSFYNGTTLLGTATSSPYTYTWNAVAAGTYSLTAVATDSTGATTTSSAVSVTVNIPPTISLTAPLNNASFIVPASITLTSSVSDSLGTVLRVDYYAGSLFLGEATSSPYTVVWTSANAGTYSLTAKATDSSGNVFYTSAADNIIVNPHTAPTVSITAPTSGASFAVSSNISMTADASVTAGTITKVDFYYNGTYIQSVYSSPYSLTWNNVQAGSYSLTAIATDSYNSATTSSPINITVGSSVAPTISTQPTSLTVTAPATATFTVAATGSPTPTYQWMQEASGSGSYSAISGATSASYTTPATTISNSGTSYECVVTNSAGMVTSSAATLTVNPAPVAPTITTQPTNVTVTAPATAVFTVAATGTPIPTYQWMQSVDGVTFTNITGATSASYTTPATASTNNGTQYECVISNSAGNITSNAATLTVNVIPNITTQPINATVTAPNTATFTVAATGAPAPTYQWMQEISGANTFTAITGATSPSYTTPATTISNNGTQYECVISNAAGSVTSNAAALTVNVMPAITTQPFNATITAPATATFTVVATGTPAPTYQWMQSVDGVTFTNITGATSASYTTPATTTANSGTSYQCVVTNSAGSVTSTAASLTVNVIPNIVTQPINATVTAPEAATFTVAATGAPAPTYQWMQEISGANTFTAITGATSASYSTPATTISNNGTQYECVVSNAAGSVTSNIATLTVNVIPNITTQPINSTVTAPSEATFTVNATGTPTPTYQWMQSVDGVTFTTIIGATNSSYTTQTTMISNSGTQYECVVTNIAGSITSNVVTLTVNAAPSITLQPVNATVTAPATATFTVSVTGTPAPTYQWMQSVDGVTFTNITGATSASYTTPATTTSNSGTSYQCIVTNSAGMVTSNSATLTVNPTPVVPAITTQPTNASVTAPATATFAVVATGTPTPSYQWMQEASGAGTFTAIIGATSSSYTTSATAIANNGTQYECVVTNSAGSVTSTPVLLTVVNPIPDVSITSPANSSMFTSGSNVTITATASEANGTINSVSFYNGTTLLGTSSTSPYSYTVNNISVGTYNLTATATDAYGDSSTSAPVTVTVSGQPVVSITSPANNSILAASSNMTITANASEANGTINSVSFYNGTTLLGTSTTSPYSYTVNNIPVGTYNLTATATDANGVSVTSSPVSVTVNVLPVVSITSPANNSTLTAGSNMTITATASETSGTISRVSFYNGMTLLGTSTTSPYSYSANTVTVGVYNLTAIATDANGKSTTSVPVTVTVTGQPVVGIASPANQSTLTTGSINITAIATENYGSISSVSFYNGTTLLGTVNSTSQAFTYSWINVPSGTYNITAVATDIIGTTATSSPITLTTNSSTFTYAVDDNIATKTDALNHTTSYQYDNDNRLLKTTFADNSTVASAYDLFGNQTSVTDQRGNILTKTYDAYERLAQTKDPLNGITQFAYDTEGHLVTLTDANGHATTYTYDPNGKVLTQTNALNLGTTFTYDPVGNVATRTDANGKVTNYTYDALNRLTNASYPDSTSVVNVYDIVGRKTSMTDATGKTIYTYDNVNRLSSKTAPGLNSEISYTYDSEGNRLTTIDQNDRYITNTYDALNRLATVTDPKGTTSYGYDAVSNRNLVTLPNGVTESYTYDALNRVLTDVNAKGATVISSLSNVYDVAGMITKKTLQDGSWTAYSYDSLNRLLEETKQTSSAITYDYVYTYDPVGNRLTWTKNTTLGGFWSVDSLNMPSQVLTNMTNANYGNTANPTQALSLARSYTYDNANRLSNWSYGVNIYSSSFPIQTDTYTYDNNGNRLTKQVALTGVVNPQQTGYSYDFENRLNQLNYTNVPGITGTQTDNLIYNGEGLRTQAVLNSVATNYLYDGSNILNERNSSSVTTKTYTRGLDLGGGIGSLINQTASSTTQYYDYNDLGSTSDLTSSTGIVAQSYNYDAFGNLLAPQVSGDTNRYLFSTKEFDSRSGLGYFGGRYYDPEIGRWLTPDPLGFVDGPNLYVYCNNNPINIVDPYGFMGERLLGDASNFFAGFGDFITFGATNWLRNQMGINNGVDSSSGFYTAGEVAGFGADLGLAGVGSLNAGGQTVLYSGEGALEAAQAGKGTGQILADTLGGQGLNGLENLTNSKLPQQVWDVASAIFSGNASGEVQIFLRNASPEGTFMRVEQKVLDFFNNTSRIYK